MVVASYLIAVFLVLIFLANTMPSWKLFTENYVKISTLRILVIVLLIILGIIFQDRRRALLPYLNSDRLRYTAFIFAAIAGIVFNLDALEYIVFVYGAYAILFINVSLDENRLYKPAHKILDYVLAIIFRVDGRVPVLISLILIVMLPVFLIWKCTVIAENIAVYAYYLLIIGIIVQIFETRLKIDRDNNPFPSLFSVKTLGIIFRSLGGFFRQLFTRKKIAYVLVFLIITGVIYGAKHTYWKKMQRRINASPEYRSEMILLQPGPPEVVFPPNADTIQIPLRIRHPLSKPFWWNTKGPQAVKVGAMWFQAGKSGQVEAKEYTEYRSLKKPVFINNSVEMTLALRRPPVRTGKNYEVWIGLVSGDKWWFAERGDNPLKIKVRVEKSPDEKEYFVESKIGRIRRAEMDEAWSWKIYDTNDYRSSLKIVKNDYPGTIRVSVTNKGKLPWPVHNLDPIKMGIIWVEKVKDQGTVRYVHLLEKEYNLPDTVLPGEQLTMDLSFNPEEVPAADELWIGMVHDNRTWFYERGDQVVKLNQNFRDKDFVAREIHKLRVSNDRLSQELRKFPSGRNLSSIGDWRYRSEMRILNRKTGGVIEARDGLILELEMTNKGKMAWKTALLGNKEPVNLGILWFETSNKGTDRMYVMRKVEERCMIPVSVLENTTIRMFCEIGRKVPPGNYEVWLGPVQEGVTWFYEKGDNVLKLNIKIPGRFF